VNIAVLIKSVVATDEPVSVRNGRIEDGGAKRVINPYDEYGLEEALRWKENAGATVTVLSAGDDRAVEALRTALAMGADEAVWIRTDRAITGNGDRDNNGNPTRGTDPVNPENGAAAISDNSTRGTGEADEHAISLLLAEAIRRGGYGLVFAGHLSVDNGAGQVAIRVAELLGWPHAGAIVRCEAAGDGTLRVTRDAEGDSESWELPLPAVLTAQQGLNEPRYPALAGIMKAKRKPLAELDAAELGVAAEPLVERLGCEAPPERPAGRQIGGGAREQAAELLALLRNEAKVVKGRGE